ncbi:HPF/RaiA family ribosome-associated protein [Mycoplasma sp. SG1]|uniref:HPF/RaiA family ribosome-associated protein n=1 Tax=Mycoplasma sp. SG1 TaxID=2810348 RepID=UPI002024A512|nr:HPF/RaiA family ribosome-associated protein [Mycoplasma sp. SG1]URM53126.1 HPF/RaiA family ribosome-associated protein [Mycoplasma sp. SG1]
MRIECSYRNYQPIPVFSEFVENEFSSLKKYSLVTDDTLLILSINYHEKTSRYKIKVFVKNLKSINSIFSEIKGHDLHKLITKLKSKVESQIRVLKETKHVHNNKTSKI